MSRPIILIVEDDVHLAGILALRLERRGYGVVVENAVPQALQAVRHQRPDLSITDVHLAQGTGHDLRIALKEICGFHAPIVYLTGTPNAADRRQAERLGAAAFIEKPFDFVALLDQVARHVKPGPVEERERHNEIQAAYSSCG